ncbi:TonB-dependent siderophore receptor [Novosphingobium sp. TCA1]|nr:TonB-dependent receptor [Novosphingobium sp. TCA1]
MTISMKTRGGARASGRLMAAVLLAGTTMGLSAGLAAPALAQEARSYDIPAGALADVLNTYARQAGVELAYRAELTAGISSPGLKGSFSPAEALSRILAGSGLTFRQTGPRAFTLEAAPRTADGTIQLGPVQVQGSDGGTGGSLAALTSDPAVSEGTRSYTVRSTSTATKLALSPRETPQSVSVVTRQKMDDQNVQSLDDIARTTTGITYTELGTDRSTYYARGSEITDIQFDGIPSNISENYSMDVMSTANMAIYDRVEVVRGANGLLQGTGNPSAAINLVRKRATRDFQLGVEAGVGSWSNYRGQVDVSGPITKDGDVRARAVAFYNSADSYRDGASRDNRLLYLTAEGNLTPGTLLRVGGTAQRDYNNGYDWGGLNTDVSGAFYDLPRSASLAGKWAYLKRRNYSAFGELQQQIGSDWKIVVAPSAIWSDAGFRSSYPARSSGNIYRLVVSDVDYRDRQVGLDVYATGHYRLLGGEHQLVLGGSLRRDKFDFTIHTASNTPTVDITDYDYASITAPVLNTASTYYKYNRKEGGLYGSTRLGLFDGLHAILGARLSWSSYTVLSPYVDDEYRSKARFLPYAGVVYDLDDHHSLYASYTEVYKTQSYYSAGNTLLDPIQGQNYEAGVKGEYFDGRLNASLAVFQSSLLNMPEATTADRTCGVTGTSTCYVEGGRVRNRGFEVEVSGSPLPDWNATLGFTYSDPEYVAGLNKGTDYNTRIPRKLFKFSTDYRLPGSFNRMRLGGDLYVQSRMYTQTASYTIKQGGYALVGLHARYDVSEAVELGLNVNNLLDKTYYQSIPTSNNFGGLFYGDPRSVMATVRGRF